MNTTLSVIYLNKDSPSSVTLYQFLFNNLEAILTNYSIEFRRVNKKNVSQYKKNGIREFPTLVINGEKFNGVDNIKKRLGYSKPVIVKSDEEQVDDFMMNTIMKGVKPKKSTKKGNKGKKELTIDEDEESGNEADQFAQSLSEKQREFEKRSKKVKNDSDSDGEESAPSSSRRPPPIDEYKDIDINDYLQDVARNGSG